MKNTELQKRKNFIINVIYFAIFALLIYLSFKLFLRALLPFVIGGIIAAFSQKPAIKICKKLRLKMEYAAVIISMVVCILIITVFSGAIYLLLFCCKGILLDINEISALVIEIAEKIKLGVTELIAPLSPQLSSSISVALNKAAEEIGQKIAVYLTSYAANIATLMPSVLFSILVAVVSSCYISKYYRVLKSFIAQLLGEEWCKKVKKIKYILKESVLKLIKGYFILSTVTFSVLVVGFLLIKIRFPLLIAAIISLVDLLPVLGAGTVLIPWGLIELVMGNGLKGFLLFVIYLITIVVRNFSEPKVIGNQMGINPLFTLLAMFIGLRVASFWGLIIFPIVLIVVIKYYKDEINTENNNKIL